MATPTNKSFLHPTAFRLLIPRLPNVEFFCTSVTVPDISFSEAIFATNIGVNAYYPGDKITFMDLSVTYLIDEDMANYKEVYDWMRAITPANDPETFKALTGTTSSSTNAYTGTGSDLEQYEDITLVINTNKNNPNKFMRFYDAFPIALGGFQMSSESTDVATLTSNISFRFTYFNISDNS